MAVLEAVLPEEADFGFRTDRPGPITAPEFEAWAPSPDNPVELVEGWPVPMSPGNFLTGEALTDLAMVLRGLVRARGWRISQDARHRLPLSEDTVLYPDLVIHCTGEVDYLPGTETVGRVPELVIELLSKETADRDRTPAGAKFLAYQRSGVQEYYYALPDGREAAGFRLEGGVFRPLEPDAEGFFSSPLLRKKLRLVPAAAK